MITPEDSTQILIFEQQRQELERKNNTEFPRSSYPKQVEIYTNMKKYHERLQAYVAEVSARNTPSLDLLIEIKELSRKAEALKTKMKKHII